MSRVGAASLVPMRTALHIGTASSILCSDSSSGAARLSSAVRCVMFVLLVASPCLAAAQSTSGAAIEGTVGVAAAVTVINHATGQRLTIATQPDGRFTIENVPAGGPYTVEVRAPGYAPARVDGIMLVLGQRYRAQLTLTLRPIELSAVTVRGGGTADPIM